MTFSRSPVVAGWELALRLKGRREELGIDVAAIASKMGFTRNYWSAVENEHKLPSEDNLAKIIKLFRFDKTEGQELLDLRVAAREHNWINGYSKLLHPQLQRLFAIEDGADGVRVYESVLLPGLLQTPEYSRAIMTESATVPQVEVDQRVELRQRRQARLLSENPPRLTAMLSEAAIRQQIGGSAVLRRQLAHLVQVTEAHPDVVEIRIIPFTATYYDVFGSSVSIFDFTNPRLPTIAWQETVTSWRLIEDPIGVRDIVTTFDAALTKSLTAPESAKMIHRAIQELA